MKEEDIELIKEIMSTKWRYHSMTKSHGSNHKYWEKHGSGINCDFAPIKHCSNCYYLDLADYPPNVTLNMCKCRKYDAILTMRYSCADWEKQN